MKINDFEILEDDELILSLILFSLKKQFFYYKIYDKNENFIGTCGIRLNSDEYLGNVEYEIFPDYRGNNYAYKAIKLLSNIANKYNVDNLTITADPTNIASNKTILKLGTKFVVTKDVPKYHKLYKTSHSVNIYEWDLKEGRQL
jgi:predicted acetyltransferase